MNKKYVIVALAILAVTGFICFTLLNRKEASMTQAEAIKQAQEFQPEGGCLTVLTPAVHKSTGAQYTFPSSCVPEGWK